MPVLTRKIEARGGPFLDVAVMQTSQYAESLKLTGHRRSGPLFARALIDTGAGTSAIDRGLAETLALEPRGEVFIHTPSTGTAWERRETYDVCLVLGHGERSPLARTVQAVESEFAAQGFLLIVGRDILNECALIYNGPAARFSIKWAGGK